MDILQMWKRLKSQMKKTMASAEGQATVADLANFASGGVTLLMGIVEN